MTQNPPEPSKRIDPIGQKHAMSFWVSSFLLSTGLGLGALGVMVVLFFAPDMIPMIGERAKNGVVLPDHIAAAVPPTEAKTLVATASNESLSARTLRERQLGLAVPATPQSGSGGASPQLAEERLASLEEQVRALSQSSAFTQSLVNDLKGMHSDLVNTPNASVGSIAGQLSKRLENMGNTLKNNQGSIKEIAFLLAKMDHGQTQIATLILASNALRVALQYGGPYVQHLRHLEQYLGDDAVVAAKLKYLQSYAETGLPSGPEMKDDLVRLQEVIAKGEDEGLEMPMKRQVMNAVGEVVSVRRVGQVASAVPVPPAIPKAYGYLEQGNTVAAAKEIVTLAGGPQAALAQPLIDKAGAILAAQGVLDDIDRHTANLIQQAKIDPQALEMIQAQ
jgi:hypothetical protein